METTVKNATYHEQMDIQNTLQLREVLKTLPGFAKGYFRAIEPTTSTKTRISYAYDIRTFFRYLQESNPLFKDKEITELKVDILDQLDAIEIEEYQEYLKDPEGYRGAPDDDVLVSPRSEPDSDLPF